MKKEIKNLIIIAIVGIVVIGGIFAMLKTPTNSQTVDQALLIHEDSYELLEGKPINAKVTVVEFGDFECPACGFSHGIFKQILLAYPDQVNLVFRHYPLPQHKTALIAAEAAEAAGEQGKFWQMYDLLYENQEKWSAKAEALDIFAEYAKQLNLDVEKFKKDIQDEKYKEKIKRDQADGDKLILTGTPTIYINGQKYTGGLSFQGIKNAIEAQLNPKP